MSKRINSTFISLTLVMVLLTACGSLPFTLNGEPNVITAPENPPAEMVAPSLPETLPPDSPNLLAAYQGTLENIYTMINPSVVNIRVVKKVESQLDTFSQIPGFPFFSLPQGQEPPQQYQSGLGSGFVWDQEGHIVTNNHVVDGADKIEVTFSDGTIVPAEMVGSDPDSDLAVIKVDLPSSQLHPVQMADSNTVKVGQLAVAIGNPFGLQGTMTVGIVSALGRSLPVDATSGPSFTIPDIIQTDAPINPGNSGGILVDSSGQVIGLTSAIESPVKANAGIGFAIPSAIVQNVVPALITDGHFDHPWLGISGTSLIPDLAKAMDLEPNQRGVLVADVFPSSPAEKAGLKGSDRQVTIEDQPVRVGGDVITAINGQTVSKMDDLIAYLGRSTSVGQVVTLTILRDGKSMELDVTLMARPAADQMGSSQVGVSQGIQLGIIGTDLNESIAEAMQLPKNQTGVLVQQVDVGGLADKAGLRGSFKPVIVNGQQILVGGDVIISLNGESITSVQGLRTALAQIETGQEFTLTILRDGAKIQLNIRSEG